MRFFAKDSGSFAIFAAIRRASSLVSNFEQTGLPEYRSIDMWCRFLETAHELGGDAERPRLSLSNSSTDHSGGKRRSVTVTIHG